MLKFDYFFSQVYHNVISKYLPKLYHFEFDHMELGVMLAALDNNNNCNRSQKVTKKFHGNISQRT